MNLSLCLERQPAIAHTNCIGSIGLQRRGVDGIKPVYNWWKFLFNHQIDRIMRSLMIILGLLDLRHHCICRFNFHSYQNNFFVRMIVGLRCARRRAIGFNFRPRDVKTSAADFPLLWFYFMPFSKLLTLCLSQVFLDKL